MSVPPWSTVGEQLIISANRSSTTSLPPRFYEHVEENGRTYHRFRQGSEFPFLLLSGPFTSADQAEYMLPNDEVRSQKP